MVTRAGGERRREAPRISPARWALWLAVLCVADALFYVALPAQRLLRRALARVRPRLRAPDAAGR